LETEGVYNHLKSIDIESCSAGDDVFTDFNRLFDTLRSFKDNFMDENLQRLTKQYLESADNIFKSIMTDAANDIRKKVEIGKSRFSTSEVGLRMVCLKKAALSLSSHHASFINSKIDWLLVSALNSIDGARKIYQLGIYFQKLTDSTNVGIGRQIIADHAALEGFENFVKNAEFQRFDISIVLSKIKGDHAGKKILKSKYDIFDKFYNDLTTNAIRSAKTAESLQRFVAKAKAETELIIKKRGSVPRLLAYIFAYWTLAAEAHLL
jgi:hypothetical protein